jgi:hypothetical protein
MVSQLTINPRTAKDDQNIPQKWRVGELLSILIRRGDSILKTLSTIFLITVLVSACSGVDHKSEPLTVDETTRYEAGYQNWKRLNSEPIIRRGQSEAWYSFISPTSRVENTVFAPGSVLVKEVRHIVGEGDEVKVGDLKMLSLMVKGESGWKYIAVDPVSGQPAKDVDTDGCLWCHEDRKNNDFTFRALDSL